MNLKVEIKIINHINVAPILNQKKCVASKSAFIKTIITPSLSITGRNSDATVRIRVTQNLIEVISK